MDNSSSSEAMLVGHQVNKQPTPIGLQEWNMMDEDCKGVVSLKMTSVRLRGLKKVAEFQNKYFPVFSVSLTNSLANLENASPLDKDATKSLTAKISAMKTIARESDSMA